MTDTSDPDAQFQKHPRSIALREAHSPASVWHEPPGGERTRGWGILGLYACARAAEFHVASLQVYGDLYDDSQPKAILRTYEWGPIRTADRQAMRNMTDPQSCEAYYWLSASDVHRCLQILEGALIPIPTFAHYESHTASYTDLRNEYRLLTVSHDPPWHSTAHSWATGDALPHDLNRRWVELWEMLSACATEDKRMTDADLEHLYVD